MKPRVLLAAAVAVAAVALGLLLGLAPNGRVLLVGPLRTFALAAALCVVLTHLLPEAFSELGLPALLLFAATSTVPAWIRLVSGIAGTSGQHRGHALSAGYAGLLAHHVGDGLGLGAYSELPGGPLAHVDVLVALAVHTVPLVAVVSFAFRAVGGISAALSRSAGLALASVGGVLLSGAAPPALAHSLSAWIAAGVAGLLVHVVTHDLDRDLPVTPLGRGLDLAAAAAGVAATVLAGDPELTPLRGALGSALVAGALRAAPAVVVAGALGAWLARLRHPFVRRWLWPLPAPTFGLDGVLVAVLFAGFRFALAFLVGTLLISRIATLHAAEAADSEAWESGGWPLWSAVERIARRFAPWLASGLVLSALLVAALPDGALASFPAFLALGAVALVGLPAGTPPATAVLIAVALWDRGLAPEAALAFALIAAAPGAEALAVKAAHHGRGVALWLAIATLLVGVGVGSAVKGAAFAPLVLPSELSVLCLFLLLPLAVLLAWQHGVRGLLVAIFPSHDTAAAPHAHASPGAP